MRRILLILFISVRVFASNVEYISGNITYKHISGACPFATYEITVTLFTKYQKAPASAFTIDGAGGFTFIDSTVIGNHIIKSHYKAIHSFPSCGVYVFNCTDTVNIQPAKNTNPNNKVKFFTSTQIVLGSFLPPIDSYIQFNSPATTIFKNIPFHFNTITSTSNIFVYDSIVHSLVSNYMGTDFNLYIPSGVKINRLSGELQWQNPDTLGAYAFLVNTIMYTNGQIICNSVHYYKFNVVNQSQSYTCDSINKVPVSTENYKEIIYTAGNTYSFSAVYTDNGADSVKLFSYPIDFFTTAPNITIVQNNIKKNTLLFSWSPLVADERLYPYNYVLNTRSYYGIDSVANNYETVSFFSSVINSIKQNIVNNNINIYPNPTIGILNISNEKQIVKNSTITITNAIGQVMLSIPFTSQIDISSLSSGIYYLTIQDTSDKKTVKIIKQ